MRYLIDTNVISEVRKPKGAARVKGWAKKIADAQLYISALTIGEVRNGIERKRRSDPTQSAVFEAWLNTIKSQFRPRILDVDAAVAEEYGRMTAVRPLPIIDGLIAATAKVHGMVLVTRNTHHVEGTGVLLYNPWGT